MKVYIYDWFLHVGAGKEVYANGIGHLMLVIIQLHASQEAFAYYLNAY